MYLQEEEGEVKLATFSQALADLPSGGPAYLPSSSYREMEEWSLPPSGYHRLESLKETLGSQRMASGESPLIRGSHWRNFLETILEPGVLEYGQDHCPAPLISRLPGVLPLERALSRLLLWFSFSHIAVVRDRERRPAGDAS